jgi:endonuclease/exonuclease/phosphatase family metal-dependent hydrolase
MEERAGLTVVTWNAQGSHGLDVPAAADALGALRPDVLLLQEVQRHQLVALAGAMAMPHARWWFKHWPVRIPAEGLGVAARFPLDRVETQTLARRWQPWSWRRRVAVHATVMARSGRVPVVDVHLGAGVTVEERIRQARSLLDRTQADAVVGGDLNAGPGSRELAILTATGRSDAEARCRAPGTPAPATNWGPGPRTAPPTQRLDYVLVPDGVTVTDAFVPDDWACWAQLSDHVPVVARVRT